MKWAANGVSSSTTLAVKDGSRGLQSTVGVSGMTVSRSDTGTTAEDAPNSGSALPGGGCEVRKGLFTSLVMVVFAAVLLVGCETKEVKRETGYKGRARVDPWLAAERFCEPYPGVVRSLASWVEPTESDAVWFVPAGLLGNTSFTRRLTAWVERGGHLVVMVDHAEAAHDDWTKFAPTAPPDVAFTSMMEDFGVRLVPREDQGRPFKAKRIRFGGERFAVDVRSDSRVAEGDGKAGAFVSVQRGPGRLSVLTDGRIFRNRWIAKKDHAALLDALVRADGRAGDIGFTRGAGLSVWGLAREHLWPVLLGLAVLVILWLWKNLSRFGPLEAAAEAPVLRGYEHHLEALGDFQWRLDHAAGLLGPLRSQIVDRGQRACQRSGHRDGDFCHYLADLAGLPQERVQRALSEAAVPDAAILTLTTADLQKLLQVLH